MMRSVVWLGCAVAVASACGGRSVSHPDDGSAGDGETGGVGGSGGGPPGSGGFGGSGLVPGTGGSVVSGGGGGVAGRSFPGAGTGGKGVAGTGFGGAAGSFGKGGAPGKGGFGGSAGFGGKGGSPSGGRAGVSGEDFGGFGGTGEDPCLPNPCKNGGSCFGEGVDFICSCPAGLSGPTCETGSLVVDAHNRGWWESTGRHDSTNDNTLTGYCACSTGTTNSYFTFKIPPFSGSLQRVVLVLEHESYASQDTSETLAVHDVSTDAATLEASGMGSSGMVVFDDLQSGVSFGEFNVSAGSVGALLQLALNAVPLVAAARGGTFSVGVHMTSYSGRVGIPEYVRFSELSESRVHQLRLEITP